jgi:hypothetical protein
MISVAILNPDEALDVPWDDLKPFAHNAFLHPIALKGASDAMLATIYVLVAWETSVEPARLVGLWAVQSKNLLFWPYLEALPFIYAFESTPVLNPDYADDVMPAFLAAIAGHRSLSDALYFRDLDAAGREYSAIERALAGHPKAPVRTDQRPIASREGGIKRSGSARKKKLRQNWNRLAAIGSVEVVNDREPDAVRQALEVFLEMEAASWKGSGGTAMLNRPGDAAFARQVIGAFADRGEASVAMLKLDGRPIATLVIVYCGKIARTWKTSFDPALGKHSPGALLADRICTDLIDSGEVDLVDSCARQDGLMGQLFAASKPMVDMVVSVTLKASLGYRVVSGYFRLREALKAWRDRARRKRHAPRAAVAAAALRLGASPAGRQSSPAASSRDSKADRAA